MFPRQSKHATAEELLETVYLSGHKYATVLDLVIDSEPCEKVEVLFEVVFSMGPL
jgi:hypothetical protein